VESPDGLSWKRGLRILTASPRTIEPDRNFSGPAHHVANDNRFTTIAEATVSGDSLNHRARFDGEPPRRNVAPADGTPLRFTAGPRGALYVLAAEPDRPPTSPAPQRESIPDTMTMKSESFGSDPGWVGVNNRSARTIDPVPVRQDFGYSPDTAHAGGESAVGKGEIGGFVTPAGEAAFYGMPISPASLDQPLQASGMMSIEPGGTHVLLGFFNSRTLNDWRTPNTIAIRLNGRGKDFFAYVEYCTSRWRAGGDTTPFPSVTDPATGRWNLLGFPCRQSLRWTLNYDPRGNGGNGTVTATIGPHTARCNLDDSHKQDGATFTHFGIVNVMKSADSGSEVWFDDLSVNGSKTETFARDPKWEGRNNRATYPTRIVRPRFDFGFSNTNFAGGAAPGELGGQVFRGDCRFPEKMACYGDRVGPLTLAKPLRAKGRIAVRRGVSDSTALFGFYHSKDSMQSSDSQRDGVPESVLGIHIEGPSSEGFRFYPVMRNRGTGSRLGAPREFPSILPDGKGHDWCLDYDPAAADGRGSITVTLDQHAQTFDLDDGDKVRGTTFDRFGIVTSWIDGNSQDVYWDDVSYTSGQK
jgi:hypothetical protein